MVEKIPHYGEPNTIYSPENSFGVWTNEMERDRAINITAYYPFFFFFITAYYHK